MRKFLEFLVTGVVLGTVLGWLLSLVSGDYYVTIGVGIFGTIVGIVLGIIHRKDP